jgi:hypothetical protein
MIERYAGKSLIFVSLSILLLVIASCKKDNNNNNKNVTPPVATPTQIGLYEADSGQYRELQIAVSQIGNQTIDDGLVFDTGSGGMVFDAQGIIPPAMITSSGFVFPNSVDSVVVNGITITNQTSTLQYGADSSTLTTVYGNLAYAPVVIGDQGTTVTIKRLPFCIYYKATQADGTALPAHYFDTFGVNSEYIYFSGNSFITSPFSYYTYGNGLTQGFKMAQLNNSNFSEEGNFVPGAVTLGLTASDLSSSSGFNMNTVNFYQGDGYVPAFTSTIKYNTNTVSTYSLFDTGTSGYSYIEDPAATSDISQLPLNSTVSLSLPGGFSYSYSVDPIQNLTYIENPNKTGGEITIFSIDFFLNNEYLQNFSNQKIGLKNN